MLGIYFEGKRKDNGEIVRGNYFRGPLTLNSNDKLKSNNFSFLAGEETFPIHCIETNGLVHIVDPLTVKVKDELEEESLIEFEIEVKK